MLRILALAAVASLEFTGAALAESVAFYPSRLLDVETGRYVNEPVVLVENGRIVSVGAARATQLAAGVQRIDLPGLTLLPGLIDMHVHLDSDPSFGGYTGLQFGDRFWSVLQVPHAQATLSAGFTTVRNVGADAWNDVGLRQAIEEGKIIGPRIITATYSFGATGGHCDSTYFPPSMAQASPYNADNPDEVRRVVRELRKHGAQAIKICATGGVFSRNTEPGQQQMTLAEMTAVVEEARMWGLHVAAHAHGASGIADAIRAGVTTIEHASLIDDEGVRLARRQGAYLSMDIYNTDYTQAEGAKNGVLEDNLRKDREIGETQRRNFERAHAAGVRMVYGTDAGIYPHGQNAKQFAVMVRYGMTPIEAIRSATVNAADALGMAKDIGKIAPGRYADFVALAGDPLADITALERASVVIKGGAIVNDARR